MQPDAQVGGDPLKPADAEAGNDLDDAHRVHTITRVRIAYVCYWFLLDKDGVAYKIDGQVDRWREAGHDVEVFCLTRPVDGRMPSRPGWRTIPFESTLGRMTGMRRLAAEVTAWVPDAIYLRYDFFGPPVPRLLRSFVSVVEVNADDQEEVRLRRRHRSLSRFYNELNRRALFRSARGLVCVTHELAAKPNFAGFGKPTLVIGNGVDLARIRELPPPAVDGPPRVVFLGSSGQRWHGVDKISLLAEKLPEARFDIIGYPSGAIDFPVTPNMQVHPPLSRTDYEPLLARADMAIGTLALHRKNMSEACPLKVREYLGHGLPVVIAYEDTDFTDEDPWFLLRLPNRESNIAEGFGEISAFLNSVRGRRVSRTDVEDRIGSHEKERRRLDFIGRLLP